MEIPLINYSFGTVLVSHHADRIQNLLNVRMGLTDRDSLRYQGYSAMLAGNISKAPTVPSYSCTKRYKGTARTNREFGARVSFKTVLPAWTEMRKPQYRWQIA